MAIIEEADASWSSGTTLSADETWQVREGRIFLTVESSPVANDGLLLVAGDAVRIPTGSTVKYRLAGTATEVLIAREAVG